MVQVIWWSDWKSTIGSRFVLVENFQWGHVPKLECQESLQLVPLMNCEVSRDTGVYLMGLGALLHPIKP